MASRWSAGLRDFKTGLECDQVECYAFANGTANFDAAARDERIAGIVDDALIEPGNSWAERQALLEGMSGAVADEVCRRSKLMQGAYPFDIRPASISYRGSKTGAYEFCLSVSRNPTGSSRSGIRSSAIFEWIARDILALHFGNGTRGLRTGAPVYPFENRGQKARETFLRLHEECGEFCWNPMVELDDDPSHQHLKDCGLDVVVWKPWADERKGQFFAIGQCACGKNDINVSKARELSITRLENWLRPVTWAAPQRCFLTALHIPNPSRLLDLTREAGMVFDRTRIALIAEANPIRMNSAEGIDYLEEARHAVNAAVDSPAL